MLPLYIRNFLLFIHTAKVQTNFSFSQSLLLHTLHLCTLPLHIFFSSCTTKTCKDTFFPGIKNKNTEENTFGDTCRPKLSSTKQKVTSLKNNCTLIHYTSVLGKIK